MDASTILLTVIYIGGLLGTYILVAEEEDSDTVKTENALISTFWPLVLAFILFGGMADFLHKGALWIKKKFKK